MPDHSAIEDRCQHHDDAHVQSLDGQGSYRTWFPPGRGGDGPGWGVNTKGLSLAARVKITKKYAQACAAAPGKDQDSDPGSGGGGHGLEPGPYPAAVARPAETASSPGGDHRDDDRSAGDTGL